VETVRNFGAELFSTEVGGVLLVCAVSEPEARSTMHPALRQAVEMALPSLRIVTPK